MPKPQAESPHILKRRVFMKKPLVIGIAGGTCSGKSYFCDMLENAIVTQTASLKVFHMDDYYKQLCPTTVAPITRKVYVEHNHPDALELERFYSDLSNALANNSLKAVVVEGVFALMLDTIREALDIKIFVDLRDEERLARRLKRHLEWGQDFSEIADRYLDTVRYRHDELVEPSRWFADIVLNGNFDYHGGADMTIDMILSRIKKSEGSNK